MSTDTTTFNGPLEFRSFLKENNLSHLEQFLLENGITTKVVLIESILNMKGIAGLSTGDNIKIQKALNLKVDGFDDEMKDAKEGPHSSLPTAYPIGTPSTSYTYTQREQYTQERGNEYQLYRDQGREPLLPTQTVVVHEHSYNGMAHGSEGCLLCCCICAFFVPFVGLIAFCVSFAHPRNSPSRKYGYIAGGLGLAGFFLGAWYWSWRANHYN